MPDPDQERTERRAALSDEYATVVGNFRALTEIRFKLIGLLPLASLAAAAVKPDPRSPGSLPFALFGLATTIAIAAYNKRNDQLYDQLVGRAAAIERELGTPDGAYANRLTPWLSFRKGRLTWTVDHRLSVAAIYFTTATFWLYLALEAAGVGISGIPTIRGNLDWLKTDLGAQTVSAALRWLLAAFAFFITLAVACWLKDREKTRRKEMRAAVKRGVESIMEAERDYLSTELGLDKAALDHVLSSDAVVPGAFLNSMNRAVRAALVKECITASSERANDTEAIDALEKRIAFYARQSASQMRLYIHPQPGERRAAQMMALLTDLPPTCIYDVAFGRR
ncbi:MAG: hypothetical protein JOY90_37440 [Bradyrhizobium sp.]|uniref:hypothetical protein n=1 Tax=Bradyrhizobium sp. TaxID=376 RepID=UPI001D6F6F20|nr:hypothetical protein [Bradyrhizobium sp.]MBV9566095.1 hypothetical protein [Bradyrhizobium sp.]